jgi:MYXO-CTERM domain-containing protein
MRAIAAIVCSSAGVSTASAGLLASSAMIDDFSGPSSAGLGFTRTNQGAASVSGGQGFLTAGAGGFQYLSDSPGFVASAYSGISLKVSGNLGDGALELNAIGGDMNFVAMGIDLGAYLSNGYVWVTFDQMDAAVGNDPGTIASAMSEGFGFWGIGLTLTGTTGSVQIDDFEFRTSAVPAPGALALLGVAGLAGGRRRR